MEKRVKRLEIVEKEAVEIYSSAEVGVSCQTIDGCQHCKRLRLVLGEAAGLTSVVRQNGVAQPQRLSTTGLVRRSASGVPAGVRPEDA